MPDLSRTTISTDRLMTSVWTGGWWRYVAQAPPLDVRVIAPDLRGFGHTEAKPVDATRGLGDMVDDVRSLLETLGLADRGIVNAAGWSMGAGVLMQYLLAHPDDLASVTLVAPLSPYGFGGTRGVDGRPCFDDFAATGAGGVAPEFVQRLAARDRTDTDPVSSPRVIMRQFFGPRAHAAVDEDFLLDEMLLIRTGEDFYPGDATVSPNWPTLAPGDRGVLNSMSPRHYDASAIVDLARKPPVCWLRAGQDQVVSDTSMFDLAHLGQLGAIPGWPGADVLPAQPMVQQMRSVLNAYRASGGRAEEVVVEDAAHGMPVQVPEQVANVIAHRLVR